ncbi:unnamed protein product [Somion occarium]|uniref:Uncharacterized protein n=1 Tax=Somion occarium TaxID=3059160 RepID=A0ABP1D2W8_9APHY
MISNSPPTKRLIASSIRSYFVHTHTQVFNLNKLQSTLVVLRENMQPSLSNSSRPAAQLGSLCNNIQAPPYISLATRTGTSTRPFPVPHLPLGTYIPLDFHAPSLFGR